MKTATQSIEEYQIDISKIVLIDDVQEFSVQTRNALKTVGIIMTNDLARINMRDLMYIRRIGAKGRSQILAYCRKNEIKLNKTQGLGAKIHPYTGEIYLLLRPTEQ